ncbi:serine/threonine-protein kinase ICK isoform X2 [Boleophthalmus pectinirostris]|uniref:serine/threonine-protein kinase ICK isoform X2 n=1 Tax=Boleophthalmus pectinirostris TaxID=150288 RepID=UPI00242B9DA0|nr:serine/threonine-protein kinase ICK isoform X2 [Boleophthalmus pectinirostris]
MYQQDGDHLSQDGSRLTDNDCTSFTQADKGHSRNALGISMWEGTPLREVPQDPWQTDSCLSCGSPGAPFLAPSSKVAQWPTPGPRVSCPQKATTACHLSMHGIPVSVEERGIHVARRQRAGPSLLPCFHGSYFPAGVVESGTYAVYAKGARRLCPPNRPVVSMWDLSLVLEALQAPPFEPLAQIDLKWLSMKTAFLLAMASAKRGKSLPLGSGVTPRGASRHHVSVHGVLLDVICSTASWTSLNTFARFYRVNVASPHPLEGVLRRHSYITVRYRAPEVLLRSTSYNSPIDQWAVGCIMAELYTLRPLFPGSSEVDTIFKICQVLGTPKKNDWPEGYLLANAMNFRWPQCIPSSLKTLIPNASPEAIHLMSDLLQWDPKKRPASAQALRYSYFHVGQALGTPQQILEQGRPQPNLVPMEPPLQAHTVMQQPLLLKPVPPSQPPPNQHCSSRPLQQVQPSPVSAAAQAAIYQRHTDLLREQSKHILNPEPTQGTAQSHLPFIVDKGPQTKTREQSENTNLPNYHLKPKGGRRRWGHSTGQHKGDEWEDSEDIDLSLSVLGKSNFSTEKSRHGDSALPRYSNALDYSRPKVQDDGPLNLNKTANYQEPSRTASAKQHYLRQSRYLPGIATKKNVSLNASKDFSNSHLWGNGTIPFGGTLPSRGAHGTNTIPGGYLPSFYKKDIGSPGQRGPQVSLVESTTSNYATWRSGRSHLSSNISLPTKSTLGTLPRAPVQSIHGRTDWSAKYGHR